MFGTRQNIQNEPGFPQELSGTEVFKLKVGDKIIFSKYAGTEVKFDGVEYTILKQSDILAIVE